MMDLRPWLAVLLLATGLTAPLALQVSAQERATQERPAQDRTAQDRADRPAAQSTQAEPRGGRGNAQREQGGSVLRLLPPDATNEKTITVGGRTLDYTATAGTFPLFDQTGEQSAAIFYTAYVAQNPDGAPRPLTFVFNGGPGAASAYLHLGMVGPRILPLDEDGRGAATAQLIDNPDTWLSFTDLVMIDPIGTGWSRAARSDGENAFRNVQADAQSIAKVIALYVNRNNRLASPKYLLGESYGGFRAAKVARALQREQSISVSGIVMLSPLMDGSFVFGSGRSALTAALQFPSYAAAELERRNAFTPQAMADVEHFALTDYLTTLAGKPPAGDAARAFYEKIAEMTGLPIDVVTDTRGFIGEAAAKIRRKGGQKLLSIYDGRIAVDDPFPESRGRRVDPLLDGTTRAYGSAMVAYAREELGFRTDMTYALLAPMRWDWGEGGGGRLGASVDDDLRVLLTLDPSFRLLVAHGYSDLVTPYSASRYVLDHLPVGGPDRVQLRVYRGGHMVYLDEASRHAFTVDARTFYEQGNESQDRPSVNP